MWCEVRVYVELVCGLERESARGSGLFISEVRTFAGYVRFLGCLL